MWTRVELTHGSGWVGLAWVGLSPILSLLHGMGRFGFLFEKLTQEAMDQRANALLSSYVSSTYFLFSLE